MNLINKTVLAHKGYFNAESEKTYRENSKEVCAISGTIEYIGIIELDIRKSADGVLYCYHGSLVEYYFYLKFRKSFADIKNKYHADSLQDILDVIPDSKIVFLDIKDISITADDIWSVFKDRKFKEIIIGNKSISFLRKFNKLPNQFVKIVIGNIFCNFYDLKKLRDDRFRYFEALFPFQISKSIISRVLESGMQFRCAGLFFFSRKSYWRVIEKFDIKHISSDFI